MKFLLKSTLLIIPMYLGMSNSLIAQNYVNGMTVGSLDVNTRPGGGIKEIGGKSSMEIIGSKYLSETFEIANILFYGKKSIDTEVRYDVENQVLEAKDVKGEVKFVNAAIVKQLVIRYDNDSSQLVFNNGKDYRIHGVPLNGLVLSAQLDGNYDLLIGFRVKKSQTAYVKALDAGEEAERITIAKEVYISNKKILTRLPNSKKQRLRVLTELSKDIPSYVAKNKLNLKNYDDLVLAIKYLNETIGN